MHVCRINGADLGSGAAKALLPAVKESDEGLYKAAKDVPVTQALCDHIIQERGGRIGCLRIANCAVTGAPGGEWKSEGELGPSFKFGKHFSPVCGCVRQPLLIQNLSKPRNAELVRDPKSTATRGDFCGADTHT